MPSDIFYGVSDKPMTAKQVKVAKETCQRCPVKRDCLITALKTLEPFGVWGGFTSFERKAALNKHDGNFLKAMTDYDNNVFITPRTRRK